MTATNRRSAVSRILGFGKYAFLLCVLVYATLPFYWMIITAAKPASELSQFPPVWVPSTVHWSNFIDVWDSIPLAKYMANSVAVGVMTTLLSVPVAASAAYAFFRYEFTARAVLLGAVLFAVTVPAVIVLVPFYAILDDLGLINTRRGLVLSYVVWALPFMLLLLRGYFRSSYPIDVEEAALIDGCSRASVLWRVALPLSVPGIAVASLFAMLLAWSEYLWASVVAGMDATRTASVGLQLFFSQFGGVQLLGEWMAGAVFLTIPLLAGAIFLQRYIGSAYGPIRD